MPRYVDGFVIPVPKRNLATYRRMAKACAKIWAEHGALEYHECVAEDTNAKGMVPFPKAVACKAGETVVFSWIVYASKAQRNRANARIMKDPRIAAMTAGKKMPFDCKRMVYGGFKTMVEG